MHLLPSMQWVWHTNHNWFKIAYSDCRCTSLRYYLIKHVVMEMQNDIKPLLACCHLCPSVGWWLVRSNYIINCSLVPIFVWKCSKWPRVCAEIFIHAFQTKLLHPWDVAKDLICMLGPFWRAWVNSKHYNTTLSSKWLTFLMEHERSTEYGFSCAISPEYFDDHKKCDR